MNKHSTEGVPGWSPTLLRLIWLHVDPLGVVHVLSNLDIQVGQSVKQVLTQAMELEELSGENTYHCGVCL